MELDWTTLLIQIVNFLVLVWILKRFLYRPVLAVIERRRAAIESALDEARTAREAADAEHDALQRQRSAWERERQAAHAALASELEGERTARRGALEAELQQERLRHAALRERRLDELQREAEERAIQQAARFAASLLGRVADPALDARLAELLLDELASLPDEQRRAIRETAGSDGIHPRVVTASPLPAPLLARIDAALAGQFGTRPSAVQVDAGLIGGLRVDIGAWSLAANLHDELALFRHGIRHDGG